MGVAQHAMNNLMGTAAAGAMALSHIKTQKKISSEIGNVRSEVEKVAAAKGPDSYAAQLASDTWRQKLQAIQEQRERYTKRMAGGIFNDESRQKAIAAKEQLDKKTKNAVSDIED